MYSSSQVLLEVLSLLARELLCLLSISWPCSTLENVRKGTSEIYDNMLVADLHMEIATRLPSSQILAEVFTSFSVAELLLDRVKSHWRWH